MVRKVIFRKEEEKSLENDEVEVKETKLVREREKRGIRKQKMERLGVRATEKERESD